VSNLFTPVGRLLWPKLVTPSEMSGKFEVTVVFDPGTDMSQLEAAADATAKAKWPDGLPADLTMPFRTGDEEKGPHLAGRTYICARSKTQPQIVGAQVQPIDPEDIGGIYGGCHGRASVSPFAYDVSGNKGVSFSLNNVQKSHDGDRVGGRMTAEEEFNELPQESLL